MSNYEEMAEFWDTHSVADYWEQTEPAEFEISPNLCKRYFISLDADLFRRISSLSYIRGVSTESMLNLLLEQRLHEISEHA